MRPVEWMALAVTVMLHVTNLGAIEYFGEDEPWVEFIAATFNHHLATGSWTSALEVLISGWHPPVRYLAGALGIALFGANEFGGRFFHTCAGVAIFFALRQLARPEWGRGRSITLLLYAVTAPAVLHRMNGGHGLFIACIVWAFVLLERLEARPGGHGIAGAAFLVVLAFFSSYEGIVFYPYLLWRGWVHRRHLSKPTMMLAMGILFLPLLAIGCIFLIRGPDVQGLGLGQLTMRIGTVHGELEAWNVGQKTSLYLSALGPVYAVMLLAAVAWCVVRGVRGTLAIPGSVVRLALFFGLHTLIWLVILPGPMSHTLWDYPVWTLLTGWVWGMWAARWRWVRPTVTFAAVLAGLLTFEAFNRVGDFTKKINRFYASMNVPACPSSERWGQRALARLLNERIGSSDAVVTDFGSGFPIAYLRRPIRGRYPQVLADAQAGRLPEDQSVTAIILHSFGKDFERVKGSFPFARTLIPAFYPDAPAFLVVWLSLPGDRLIALEEVPLVRVALGGGS